MTIIPFLIFIFNLAFYEAARLDKHQWISKKEKQYSWLFRLAFILAACSGNPYLFLAYSFLMAGLYDLLLNYYRKDIDDIWHLGENAKWDVFFSKRPKLYKFVRFAFPIIGIAFYVLSFFFNELPFYY